MTLSEFKKQHRITLSTRRHPKQSLPEPRDEYWESSLCTEGWIASVHKRYSDRLVSTLAEGYGKTRKEAIEALVDYIKGHELYLYGARGVGRTVPVPSDLIVG